MLDKGGYFIASEKSILGLDLGNSQGIYTKCPLSRLATKQFIDNPVLIEEDEQNETNSEADLSDSHRDSTKSIAGLNSRQTSLDTTISSSSIPQSYSVDCEVSRAAKLDESSALVTKTAYVKRVCSLLKHMTRNAEGQISGKSSTFGCYLLV